MAPQTGTPVTDGRAERKEKSRRQRTKKRKKTEKDETHVKGAEKEKSPSKGASTNQLQSHLARKNKTPDCEQTRNSHRGQRKIHGKAYKGDTGRLHGTYLHNPQISEQQERGKKGGRVARLILRRGKNSDNKMGKKIEMRTECGIKNKR